MSAAKAPLLAEFLTTPQAAEAIGIASDTLKRWRGLNRGPRHCRFGGRVFYREADLRAWIEAETGAGSAS